MPVVAVVSHKDSFGNVRRSRRFFPNRFLEKSNSLLDFFLSLSFDFSGEAVRFSFLLDYDIPAVNTMSFRMRTPSFGVLPCFITMSFCDKTKARWKFWHNREAASPEKYKTPLPISFYLTFSFR